MIYKGMFYQIKGEGFPIVFLPGIGGTHSMFDPQIQFLAKSFKTIAIDMKGSGKSVSISVKPWECFEEHVSALIELLDYLGVAKFILVGISYGGIVAQKLAISNPERVAKLVLIDTYAHTIPRNINEIKLLFYGAFIAFSPWLPSQWIKPFFSHYKKWELAYNEIDMIIENRNPKDVTAQLVGCAGLNLFKELEELDIPTLGLVGDVSPLIVNKTKEIIEHLPNGKFAVIEDAIDPSNLCQPNIVNTYLFDFIQELSSSSKAVSGT